MEKALKYKHLYFGVLAACNLLPEEADVSAAVRYEIEDTALAADTVTPNSDAYPALEVMRCVVASEMDVLRARLVAGGHTSAGGDVADGGFVEWQDIAVSGSFLNPHIGNVIEVLVDRAEGGETVAEDWIGGRPGTIEEVTRLASPNAPLKLSSARGLYAMDKGEKTFWFVGRKAKVSYLTIKHPDLPDTVDDLITFLKQPITAMDTDASAIVDWAVAMLYPRDGAHEGLANQRMARGAQRLGLTPPNVPDAPIKISQRAQTE